MAEFRVASRYAKSLLGLAIEQKQEEKIREDMLLIAETCQNSRELSNMLKNPIIKYDKKLNVLKKLFGNKVQEVSGRFIELITRKNRADLLPDIAALWLDFYNEHKNIAKAIITSATPLTGEARKKVIAELTAGTGQQVILEEKIDANIIGGYVLNIGDQQLDKSIAGQLRGIKRKFLNKV